MRVCGGVARFKFGGGGGDEMWNVFFFDWSAFLTSSNFVAFFFPLNFVCLQKFKFFAFFLAISHQATSREQARLQIYAVDP